MSLLRVEFFTKIRPNCREGYVDAEGTVGAFSIGGASPGRSIENSEASRVWEIHGPEGELANSGSPCQSKTQFFYAGVWFPPLTHDAAGALSV